MKTERFDEERWRSRSTATFKFHFLRLRLRLCLCFSDFVTEIWLFVIYVKEMKFHQRDWVRGTELREIKLMRTKKKWKQRGNIFWAFGVLGSQNVICADMSQNCLLGTWAPFQISHTRASIFFSPQNDLCFFLFYFFSFFFFKCMLFFYRFLSLI